MPRPRIEKPARLEVTGLALPPAIEECERAFIEPVQVLRRDPECRIVFVR